MIEFTRFDGVKVAVNPCRVLAIRDAGPTDARAANGTYILLTQGPEGEILVISSFAVVLQALLKT